MTFDPEVIGSSSKVITNDPDSITFALRARVFSLKTPLFPELIGFSQETSVEKRIADKTDIKGVAMTRGIFPNTDSGLLEWSRNLRDHILVSPEVYGISPEQAAEYAILHDRYAAMMKLVAPNIRNQSAVAGKNAARAELKDSARRLVMLVRAQRDLSTAQKINLGLAPRAKPTTIPAPDSAPGLNVLSVEGYSVLIQLHDSSTSGRRGKPHGAIGVSLFSYVGETPPAGRDGWRFEGSFGRMKVTLNLPFDLAPGTKVWLTGYWINGRKQPGPMAAPICTNLQGGGVALTMGLKMAA